MVEMKTDVIRTENLHFSYPGYKVLSGIDLSLEQGEVLCLLGPNGCGKTTFIDCLLRNHQPESGSILVDGKDIDEYNHRELAQKIAYVPQTHKANFPFSLTDFIMMGRTPHAGYFEAPGDEDRERTLEVIEELGLTPLKDKDYTRLSGGETRMALIARALVQETSVMVLDEPGSHLDFRNEYRMLETVVSLVEEQGRSILMSTHNPNQVFFLQSSGIPIRAAVMTGGKITLCGKPEDVLSPENIMGLFGINTSLISHENSGCTINAIIPLPNIKENI